MTSNYVKQGVPLVRNSDIKVNRFKTDLINLEENFANIHKSRAFQEEDVATVHTGDVGTSAVVPKWLDGAHGFATINSRLKRNIISPWYYSYYLNSPLLKNQLKEVITGDGRSNLNLYDFVNLKISFPTLIEQNTIVEILTTMDIEIEELVNKKSKYFLLKQGMMQELLTGKTRLI
jgi:type I restriction enzyme S subunit